MAEARRDKSLAVRAGHVILFFMTSIELRRVWKTDRFHPFTLHMADGRNVSVKHQEFLAISPTGRTVIVYQPNGDFNIVDLLLVTDLQVSANGKSRPGGKKRG